MFQRRPSRGMPIIFKPLDKDLLGIESIIHILKVLVVCCIQGRRWGLNPPTPPPTFRKICGAKMWSYAQIYLHSYSLQVPKLSIYSYT